MISRSFFAALGHAAGMAGFHQEICGRAVALAIRRGVSIA
jgi:hypothetical protein